MWKNGVLQFQNIVDIHYCRVCGNGCVDNREVIHMVFNSKSTGMLKVLLHLIYKVVGLYAVEAGIVATEARLVAEDGAGAAREVCLYGVFGFLPEAHETRVWMGSPPHAYHGRGNERGEVHVCRIHTYHYVEVRHEHEFFLQSMQQSWHHGATLEARGNGVELLFFLCSAAEKEEACRRVARGKAFYHFFHEVYRICLARVGGKRRDTYPLLEALLFAHGFGQQSQAGLCGCEECGEVVFYGIAELREHVGIILEGGVYWLENLVASCREQPSLLAVLVDMRHMVLVEVEAYSQVVGA